MLDTDTKRRIDTARDILVGKVPDPKSQVGRERIRAGYAETFRNSAEPGSHRAGWKTDGGACRQLFRRGLWWHGRGYSTYRFGGGYAEMFRV
jgi:hypothetical protein